MQNLMQIEREYICEWKAILIYNFILSGLCQFISHSFVQMFVLLYLNESLIQSGGILLFLSYIVYQWQNQSVLES